MAVTTEAPPAVQPADDSRHSSRSQARIIEAAAVLFSPALLFWVLRLRAMSPQEVPDVARHTIYIFDPRDFLLRYSTVLPVEKLREGTRVGFLVPARLGYLIFGAVPGFFATRYFFALVAIVPTYLLLRRLYGAAAGVIGIIVIMSSPVIVTAWGTDYPDSAAVSYLAGGLACLAMPSRDGRRPVWVAFGGLLLTLAFWSHPAATPLVGVTVIAYGLVIFFRDRRRLLRDAAVLAGALVVCTGLLVVASALELGRANFISIAWRGATYLGSSATVGQYHSANWAWAPYRSYILVLPAVVAAWVVVFARRGVRTPQLVIGAVCAAQVLAAFALQFLGPLWILEFHFFSSLLWGATCVTVAVVIAEIARPLLRRPLLRWLPALITLLVPLLFKIDSDVPPFGWWPTGLLLLLFIVATAWAGAALARSRSPVSLSTAAAAPGTAFDAATVASASADGDGGAGSDADADGDAGAGAGADPAPGRARVPGWFALAIGALVVVMLGAGLLLTVAPIPDHAPLKNVSHFDQPTDYRGALTESANHAVAIYRVESELPSFVGNATYPDEQLMLWHPRAAYGEIEADLGLYYDGPNEIPGFPYLTAATRQLLASRRPAEILLISPSGAQFPVAFRSLAPYRPVRDRVAVLRSGDVVVHVWLITLRDFMGHG